MSPTSLGVLGQWNQTGGRGVFAEMSVSIPSQFRLPLLVGGLGFVCLVLVAIAGASENRVSPPRGIPAGATAEHSEGSGGSRMKEDTMSRQPGASPEPSGFAPSNRAIRLTFTYEGGEIRLVARQDVEKLVPPSDPIEEQRQDQSGFWVEVQGEQGRPLYRRIMHNPIETSVEVLSDDPERPLANVPIDQPRGTFFVTIPAVAGAESVVVFSSPIDPSDERAAMRPASEIARFDLRQRPERPRPATPSPPEGPDQPRQRGRRKGGSQ
jgi:hypothetical protein